MEEGRPSRTAALVAFLRALGDLGVTGVPGFTDPTAAPLLPPPFSRAYRAARWWVHRAGTSGLRARFARHIDLLPLRTLAIDEELRAALAGGVRQLVILGAGLDGRAYRLPELADAVVFEVDHPATQGYKRAHLGGLAPRARELRWVPVDFERDALDERLAAAGHDASKPTAWVWEGVIMYLTDAGLRATLGAVRARSAPGSVLLAQYREAVQGRARDERAMRWLTRRWREPQIGRRPRDAMRAECERAGFRVLRDTDAGAWAARFGDPAAATPFVRATRLVVAEPA